MAEEKASPEKEGKVRFEISKTKLIWICVAIIVILIVIIAVILWGGAQTSEQATEAMANVSSEIGRISSILEEIASGLG